MRFIIMSLGTEETYAAPPKPEAFAAMQAYMDDLAKSGALLAAEGLAPPSQGARVEFDGEERRVVDGPFAETKELIAGITIIQAKSLEEAIEWVKRAPNASPNGKGKAEIRRLMDMEDFTDMLGDDFKPNAEIAKVKYK